jgi:hypothetical protein
VLLYDQGKKYEFSAFHSNVATSYYFIYKIDLVSHDYNPNNKFHLKKRKKKKDEWETKGGRGKKKKKKKKKRKEEGRKAVAGRSVKPTPVVWVGWLGVWAAAEMFFVDFVGSL